MNKKIDVFLTVENGAKAPVYATEGSAGADIHAFLPDNPITIPAGDLIMVPTGLRASIPKGFEIQIRPRSGLAAKFGVTVLNSPGTIDSDYRGEIKVILINHGKSPFIVSHGERIAQMVIAESTLANFIASNYLDETHRGEGGFGSTGTK